MYKRKIEKILEEILGEKVILETPKIEGFGDYTSNYALIVSKSGANPRDVASKLVEKLKNNATLMNIVKKVDIAGPGFINFWLKDELLVDNLTYIDTKKDDVNAGKDDGKKQKIMIEFAHPNTHKEMHIGHMRTLIIGEALSRILGASGSKVFRANYQGDVGPHVAKSIWGTQNLLKEKNMSWEEAGKLSLRGKAHLLGEGYVRGVSLYDENKDEIDDLNSKIYSRDANIMDVYQRTRKWSLDYYESFYKRFYTCFDKLYFESEVYKEGKEIVLKNIGNIFERSEGAVVFKGEPYGLHTRVFITKDGNPTYEAKDMALVRHQYNDFNFDRCIHVVANEQIDYFKVVIKAMELIDPTIKGKEYHLPMGMVQLVGKKMSSRTGEILKVDDLIDEVISLIAPFIKEGGDDELKESIAIGAIKYSMLRIHPEGEVVFDPKKSVSLEGDSGCYIQYTHARCISVEKKSEKKPEDIKKEEINTLNDEEEALLRKLVHFDEIVKTAAENLSPNTICEYLFEVAQKYNTFYNKHKIIGSENEDFRIKLTGACRAILSKGLNLLGIQAPERM